MIKPVDPLLRHRLDACDRANVVGFAIVVPGINLYEVYLCPVLDQLFPALGEEPVVASVDEVLIIRLRAVVLKVASSAQVIDGLKVELTVKNQGEAAAMYERLPRFEM